MELPGGTLRIRYDQATGQASASAGRRHSFSKGHCSEGDPFVTTGFDTAEKLGAREVAAWLRRHPAFLQQFPDLALTLVVPRENGPAASLASYQLEVLRDKNRELSRRLHELFGNAQENERLAVRTHQLTLALMKQTSAADTLRAMAASLGGGFPGRPGAHRARSRRSMASTT